MDKKNLSIVSDDQAASILGVATQTIRNWRHQRKGPAYIKLGRSVRYQIKDLEKFIEENRIDPK